MSEAVGRKGRVGRRPSEGVCLWEDECGELRRAVNPAAMLSLCAAAGV